MLNIVLGTTLGLDMAVVRFFGDYLDLERYRTEKMTWDKGWLESSRDRLERNGHGGWTRSRVKLKPNFSIRCERARRRRVRKQQANNEAE